jgi:hypothetical protein
MTQPIPPMPVTAMIVITMGPIGIPEPPPPLPPPPPPPPSLEDRLANVTVCGEDVSWLVVS